MTIDYDYQGDRFVWHFSVGTSDNTTVRYRAAQFEGYSQEVPDGLHNLDNEWSITVESVTPEEAQQIIEFLKHYANQRLPFQILDPDTGEWTWVDVQDWNRDFADVGARNLSITLKNTVRI